MFEVLLIGETKRLLLLLALAVPACAAAWYGLRTGRMCLLLGAFILANTALAAVAAVLSDYDHDECEHLHCTWLVTQCLLPFKDFWENHSPLLYLVLSPLVTAFHGSPWIVEISRVLSLLLAAGIGFVGWKVARKAWSDGASLSAYLVLFTGGLVSWEFTCMRPDLWNTLLLLGAIYFSMNIAEGRKWSCLLAGLAVSLALSFTIKQNLLILVPPAVILLKDRRRCLAPLAEYGAGLALGAIPLVAYLLSNHLVGDYYRWVVVFNKNMVKLTLGFPAGSVLVAVLGICALRKNLARPAALHPAHVLLLAFAACTASSFARLIHQDYYLMLWIVLGATLGCGLGPGILQRAFLKNQPAATAAVGFTLAWLLLAGVFGDGPHTGRFWKPDPFGAHEIDLQKLPALAKLCGQEPCILTGDFNPIWLGHALRIRNRWGFVFVRKYPPVRQDVMQGSPGSLILETRPPLIRTTVGEANEPIFEFLRLSQVLSGPEYDRVLTMIKADYVQTNLYGNEYYVRKDKVNPATPPHR